jgi:iron complex transport system ATP-binding protein
MTTILQANQLSVGYRSGTQVRKVISNLSISVCRGELIGIIGPNGIGKSTLLRSIAKLQDPLEGEILIDGQSIKKYSRNLFAQKVSFVSTEIIKLNHCTLRQLVSFGRSPYTNWFGQLSDEDEALVSEAIEMVGLTLLSHRMINEVSDGERQRVMIARTLAQDTDIIILDEPTAFLDMPNKFEVIHLLSELTRKKKKTILFTSHDLNIAMREADRLWLITPNALIDGAPEDLVLQHSISNLFETTRLKFDSKKGDFSITRKPTDFCKLTGKGIPLAWTKRAMERLGFETENDNYSFEIVVEENGNTIAWKFINADQTITFSSIYDLATFVKQMSR